jgi:TRAP-type uncharacterized transport system substrate-binding protein
VPLHRGGVFGEPDGAVKGERGGRPDDAAPTHCREDGNGSPARGGLCAGAGQRLRGVRICFIRKLAVRAISLPVGSLAEFAMRQLLREYRISYADLKSCGGTTTHANYNIIADAFKDGRTDLFVAAATPKHPEIATFTDVRFLAIEPDCVKGLTPLGYIPGTMPPDTFKNQVQPVNTVGFPTVLITNAGLAEPLACTITKTIVESKEALVYGHAGLAEFDPKTTSDPDEVGLPLHPGAARVYREKGWIK